MITKFTVQEINQNSIFLNTGWLKLADHIKLWRLFCWRSKSFDRSFHLKESRMECCTDIAWVDCRVGFQGSNGGIGNKQRKLQGTKVYQINLKGASGFFEPSTTPGWGCEVKATIRSNIFSFQRKQQAQIRLSGTFFNKLKRVCPSKFHRYLKNKMLQWHIQFVPLIDLYNVKLIKFLTYLGNWLFLFYMFLWPNIMYV